MVVCLSRAMSSPSPLSEPNDLPNHVVHAARYLMRCKVAPLD